jgi:hypothetical protein
MQQQTLTLSCACKQSMQSTCLIWKGLRALPRDRPRLRRAMTTTQGTYVKSIGDDIGLSRPLAEATHILCRNRFCSKVTQCMCLPMPTAGSYQTVSIRKNVAHHVAQLALNRPKKINAMNSVFWREFKEVRCGACLLQNVSV